MWTLFFFHSSIPEKFYAPGQPYAYYMGVIVRVVAKVYIEILLLLSWITPECFNSYASIMIVSNFHVKALNIDRYQKQCAYTTQMRCYQRAIRYRYYRIIAILLINQFESGFWTVCYRLQYKLTSNICNTTNSL